MTRDDMRTMLEEASEAGAERVLGKLGLADKHAQEDLDELRQLLRAWRDAKASARRAVIEWIVRALFALLLIGIALRFGLADLLR